MPSISILGKQINTTEVDIEINRLRYSESNPRIYTFMENIKDKPVGEELQEFIYDVMRGESSVTKIYESIKVDGVAEPIIVRSDTNVVVEGNSRLTVVKSLNKQNPQDERWQKMTCRLISTLTEEQEDSLLNILHGELGKTPWKTYEEAKKIYKRYKEGVSIDDLMIRFKPMREKSIKDRIWIIEKMKSNDDTKLTNYSYYNVLRTHGPIRSELIENYSNSKNQQIVKIILDKIKKTTEDDDFTAQALRKKLPSILSSDYHKKKFIETKDLHIVYDSAKISDPVKKIKKATDVLSDITKKDVDKLDQSELSHLKNSWRSMKREGKRVHDLYEQAKENYTN